jgi:hypothetical protein
VGGAANAVVVVAGTKTSMAEAIGAMTDLRLTCLDVLSLECTTINSLTDADTGRNREQSPARRARLQCETSADACQGPTRPMTSPQAKGRIERLWGTFQDGLNSELRLAGAATRADVEQVLARYLVRHNRRSLSPLPTLHRPGSRGRQHRVPTEAFCFKYRRVETYDNTVRFGPHLIDIPA